MSLPRYKITVLALSLGVASAFVGCSSNPSKKEVVDKGPQSSEQVYFEKALKSLERNQYTDAVKSLEALDTYFPTGQYTQQAQLELLYAKFKQKDYEGTIALADRFIRLNPQHPNVDYAYYVRGVANMEMNYDSLIRYTSLKQAHRDVSYIKVAYQNFVDLIRRFPSSQYSVDAAQRMKYIGQELAESEMNAARFNIQRKAWLAAAERARWVLEYYPQTPQTPEALATLAYSYQQLGDKTTSQQYIEILKLNYPNLVKSNGEVNLRAARKEGSWVNRATLGLLGRESQHIEVENNETQIEPPRRSLTNRLSFGLFDKPETEQSSEEDAAN
ncbi:MULTISPECIES: outer membrane protein assembly factor BamD [Acinetobacter]|uniref:outer membrane protein assembly factor BamD n=1 Tax=Acinetobacter TaxID=469 RepID=UPI000F73F041|nr:outer membrane protein assembly factor BamD [Acinetobacter haemolyticus]AZN67062.1 outer membrane protein assembly factor BamD [Acinetobacter haemolyticus]MCU4379495.1 outer membrane protein assembly factor BamD [Acinetobacter haemolyticus]NAR98722.1 outer membrane protein assembly factor BamD [Acinetobacter haemolyticus]RSN78120.1 outer membrane protein assembly factor BamD [Acinetobacter haemolyticus]